MDPNTALSTIFGTLATVASAANSVNQKSRPLEILKKGIKRDLLLFLVLKRDKD